MHGWIRFLGQFQRDVKLWLFCVATLSLVRALFIVVLRHNIDAATGGISIAAALLNGVRFDLIIATYWTAIPMLCSVTCRFVDWTTIANRVRWVTAAMFGILAPAACVVSIEYFREFNAPFNHFVFELIYDDAGAIWSTAVAEYHLVENVIASAIGMAVSLLVLRRTLKSKLVSATSIERHLSSPPRQVLFSLLIAASVAMSARGTVGRRPMQLKDAAITTDSFLNKAVLNPFTAMLYAVKQQRSLNTDAGLSAYLPDQDVVAASQVVFETNDVHSNLDDYSQRLAPGTVNKPPQHVFVIVMESYDAWPLLEKFRPLGLSEQLLGLGRNGLHVKAFLPASGGTMKSLVSIVSSMPEVGVHTHYRKSAMQPFSTSIAETFKRMGYRTRFFCGGYLSWQDVGNFAKRQGFEEIYGGNHMSSWLHTNEWGVDDEYLFDFVAKNLADDRPSLNVILSTSYHPPFDLDLQKKGFPLKRIPPELHDTIAQPHDKQLVKFGHLWYSDQCLGKFVKQVERKFPQSLFAITGDHYGRRFPNPNPNTFELSAVPLVLYGKRVLQGLKLPPKVAGSHIDIAPTLVELAAPKGFRYHSFGQSLLADRDDFIGIGRWHVITSDFIMSAGNPDDRQPIPETPTPATQTQSSQWDGRALQRRYNAVHGVAWWRIMHGAELPQQQWARHAKSQVK